MTGALTADAKTADDLTAVGTLPATSPAPGGGTYWITTAEQKALGLLGPSTALDGYVGFNSGKSIWDFNPNDGITAGKWYGELGIAGGFDDPQGKIGNSQVLTLSGRRDPGRVVREELPAPVRCPVPEWWWMPRVAEDQVVGRREVRAHDRCCEPSSIGQFAELLVERAREPRLIGGVDVLAHQLSERERDIPDFGAVPGDVGQKKPRDDPRRTGRDGMDVPAPGRVLVRDREHVRINARDGNQVVHRGVPAPDLHAVQRVRSGRGDHATLGCPRAGPVTGHRSAALGARPSASCR